ncbi:parathyroid hormone 4-like [Silurus meridionalis]|uniref:parathyroid hormone 4-like n=1 Tax=Silurus meridionalis TaxID=175797 RepID=UPI001EEB26A5|nr:parathyroid hormone 4-like [Silurus meridionalis]
MVQKGQSSCLLVSCMLVMVLTVVDSQENVRRAVTEHQLMHDRGRSIQSLKRLIWLSSAIERLHTAEARSLSSPHTAFSQNYDIGGDEGNNEDYSKYPSVIDSRLQQGH